MPDLTVSQDLDTLLTKQSLVDAKTYLGVTANVTQINAETAARQAADLIIQADVAFNTAKVGITPTQASAIAANTVKTGITLAQASAITVNTAKVGITPTQASAITDNTAAIVTEAGIRADADTANATAISTETSRATAAEVVNATAISNETTRATAAEVVNATAISDETTRATAAEGVNAAGIVTNATDIATNATDIATNATAIATNATAIATNATDIATETTRATAAEGVNATAIVAEAVIRADADVIGYNMIVANTTAISNETTRATGAEAVNQILINNETTRATAAEALLAPILDATFTGTTTILSADITTADFNAGAAGNGGELSWNNTEKTLDLVTGTDSVTIQVGQEIVMYCKNAQGRPLLNGEVVKVVSATGNIPTIQTATADTVDEAHKTMGVCTQDFDNNGFGFITTLGKVRGLNFPSNGPNPEFSVGQVVYLSDIVSGGLTTVKPEIEVEIGQVLRTGTTQGTLGVRVNNEASIYELRQELYPLITANESEIYNNFLATTTNAYNIANVKEYPYTTDIDNGVGSIKNVITTDGTSGYNGDVGLTSISFGSNCTTVGNNTFADSTNLSEVIFNDSVTGTIGNNCFQNCSSYDNFSLSPNINALGDSSYRACISLVTLDLRTYDLGTIGIFAFEGCTGLTSFDFPTQTGNSQYTFAVISESVLRNCTSLLNIAIPNTVTEINAAAFRDCTSLNSVNCYATAAPTLIGINQFLNINTTVINVPINATGYGTTYAGLTVNPIL